MKKAWFAVELLFGIAAAMLVITACIHVIPKGKEKDVWDIATAIGTIGSTVAAVWFATAEARRRRKTERQTAELVAAGMTLRLIHDQLTLQAAAGWLCTARTIDQSPEGFAAVGETLRPLCVWTAQDLLPLIPLLGEGAHNLAAAADQVRLAEGVLTGKTGGGVFTETSKDRQRLAGEAYGWLTNAVDLIASCIEPCQRVAKGSMAGAP
jgi:hypothetical protein